MDTLKTIGIAAVTALVIAGGFAALSPEKANEETKLGAQADIASPYLQWGGVQTYNGAMAMKAASTTCSFQSPAATSTLRMAIARISNSSTGATLQYEWGLAATAFATTTSLGRGTIASGGQGTATASSTNATTGDIIDHELTLAPNTYVNLKVGSSTPTDQAGNCYVQFVAVP